MTPCKANLRKPFLRAQNRVHAPNFLIISIRVPMLSSALNAVKPFHAVVASKTTRIHTQALSHMFVKEDVVPKTGKLPASSSRPNLTNEIAPKYLLQKQA